MTFDFSDISKFASQASDFFDQPASYLITVAEMKQSFPELMGIMEQAPSSQHDFFVADCSLLKNELPVDLRNWPLLLLTSNRLSNEVIRQLADSFPALMMDAECWGPSASTYLLWQAQNLSFVIDIADIHDVIFDIKDRGGLLLAAQGEDIMLLMRLDTSDEFFENLAAASRVRNIERFQPLNLQLKVCSSTFQHANDEAVTIGPRGEPAFILQRWQIQQE